MLKKLNINKWLLWKRELISSIKTKKTIQIIMIKEQEYSLSVAQLDDAFDIFNVEKAAYQGYAPWPLEIFKDDIVRMNERFYFILRTLETGSALAYIGVDFEAGKRTTHITNLAVHPQWQRRGLAKALLAYVMSLSRQKCFKCMILEVHEDNILAQKLYYQMNFRVIRQHFDYYEDHKSAFEMMVKIGGDIK